MDNYGIIDRLIELKEGKRWSYYRIAKESQLPESTVTNIYKRKSLPQIDTLYSLCKGFNITIYEFFNGNEKFKGLSDEEKELFITMEFSWRRKSKVNKTINSKIR